MMKRRKTVGVLMAATFAALGLTLASAPTHANVSSTVDLGWCPRAQPSGGYVPYFCGPSSEDPYRFGASSSL